MDLATAVRRARKKKGLTQYQIEGVSQSEVGAIERGDRCDPRVTTLMALESAFGLRFGTLIRIVARDQAEKR